MARDFFINGPAMVSVKGPSGSLIASLTQLGLCVDQINVGFEMHHKPLTVEGYGEVEVDAQQFGQAGNVTCNFIHFDQAILNECLRLAAGGTTAGATAWGIQGEAGYRLGNNKPRFDPNNNLIGLNIYSPVAGQPYRFYYAYIPREGVRWPLGAEKSVPSVTFRAIPYTQDPWGNGLGAAGNFLFDRTLDQ